VARVAGSSRARPETVRNAIVVVCGGAFQSVAEIATAIGRSQRIVREHIASLVRERALELLHPDTPNHPKQAYRAKREDSPS